MDIRNFLVIAVIVLLFINIFWDLFPAAGKGFRKLFK